MSEREGSSNHPEDQQFLESFFPESVLKQIQNLPVGDIRELAKGEKKEQLREREHAFVAEVEEKVRSCWMEIPQHYKKLALRVLEKEFYSDQDLRQEMKAITGQELSLLDLHAQDAPHLSAFLVRAVAEYLVREKMFFELVSGDSAPLKAADYFPKDTSENAIPHGFILLTAYQSLLIGGTPGMDEDENMVRDIEYYRVEHRREAWHHPTEFQGMVEVPIQPDQMACIKASPRTRLSTSLKGFLTTSRVKYLYIIPSDMDPAAFELMRDSVRNDLSSVSAIFRLQDLSVEDSAISKPPGKKRWIH